MSLPSDRSQRSRTAGFTLLEAMLAFAMLGMVLAATYNLSVRAMRHQIEAGEDYELTAMARALLDEYVLTYPAMPTSGTYKDVWEWWIAEAQQPVLDATEYDHYFEFVRITALVKKKSSTSAPLELSTVVARRAPGI